MGNWFTEAAAGVWTFTENDDFFGGHRRSQQPLAVYQLHVGYNFRRGTWLAVDLGRYIGGRTAGDGAGEGDEEHKTRVGPLLSLPLRGGRAAKKGDLERN